MIDLDIDLARYLAAVRGGARREAIHVALAPVQRGASAERVITDVLSPAQTEIGLGWQQGRWSVSMEHLASDITESALQVVVHHALSAPGAVREGSLGHVVVACSESEGHVLPGRMAADVLRLRGIDVTFIGPSVPPYDLAEFLGDDRPGAVALACSMPMSLVGAWRSIGALRAIGMTHRVRWTRVWAGRSMGSCPGSRPLGARLRRRSRSAAVSVGRPRARATRTCGAPERIAEVLILAREHESLLEEATRTAFATWPQIRDSDAAMRATREDLAATLHVIAAATLVGDLTLVTDFVRWFEAVLTGHGLPPALVSSAFELLLGVLPAQLVQASDMAMCGLASRNTK